LNEETAEVKAMRELKEQLAKFQEKQEATCPSCGYCPTCGRSPSYYPLYEPYITWTGETSSGINPSETSIHGVTPDTSCHTHTITNYTP